VTRVRHVGSGITRARLATFALVVCALAPSCRTPTEVVVELTSELGHRDDMTVAIQIGSEREVESQPPRVTTRSAWAAGASLGTVVVVPNADEEDFVVRVVLATARDPSACTTQDASGCVVVRRRLRFTRGESTTARIVLRAACLGVFCAQATSCAANGRCGSLDDDLATGAAAPPEDDAGAAGAADPYVAAVLEDRPRHYYRLDEPPGSTVAKDLLGRADGTYSGVKLGVTGALRASANTGAFFAGGGSVTIPGVEDLPGAFTIEAWARIDGGGDARPTIVERVDQVGGALFGYRMSRPPGTSVAFEVFRGEAIIGASARAVRFAGYSHAVALVRGGEAEVWIDGSKEESRATGDAPASAVVGPLLVGSSRAGGTPFHGAIDEIAIYDYPLPPERIRHHYDVAQKAGAP